MQRDRRLTRGLRAVDLHHPASGQPSDAEGDVKGNRAGRDNLDRRAGVVAESHHRALAELAVDLGERGVQRLFAVCGSGHFFTSGSAGLGGCTPGPVSMSSEVTLERPTDSFRGSPASVDDRAFECPVDSTIAIAESPAGTRQRLPKHLSDTERPARTASLSPPPRPLLPPRSPRRGPRGRVD